MDEKNTLNGRAHYLIVGGGSAGCVLAARLSENPENRVFIVEAGRDFDQSKKNDLTDTAGARAFMDPQYFWPDLKAQIAVRQQISKQTEKTPEPYKQAMLLGGGSSINGQIALRGAPEDYDYWESVGATGWSWKEVLPYFVKLESDHDFKNNHHGANGPIHIRRTIRNEWDTISMAMSDIWSKFGYPYLPDLNGNFSDGHGPVPLSNDGIFRNSTARQYLNERVRARKNLRIMTDTRAVRIRFKGESAIGIEAIRDAETVFIEADRVILCCGALKSPHLLMHSGIGDGRVLSELGISTVSHRSGVGQNLQDHPNIVLSGCLTTGEGRVFSERSVLTYLRYSSGLSGCDRSDMVMSVRGRSMWHAVGARICGLVNYITLPYSRGTVRLAGPSPLTSPNVDFNGLSDPRDLARMVQGARFSAQIMFDHLGPELITQVFPAKLSRRIEKLSRPTRLNDLLTRTGAKLMDTSPVIRDLIVRHMIANGDGLADVLADDNAAGDFVHQYLGTSWHACGTCKMGSPNDPLAVTNSRGEVLGTRNLFVADASLMPRVTRTNTNIPTIMIAERIADLIQSSKPRTSGL